MSQMTAYCFKCGAELDPETIYCPACGRLQRSMVVRAAGAPPPPPAAGEPEEGYEPYHDQGPASETAGPPGSSPHADPGQPDPYASHDWYAAPEEGAEHRYPGDYPTQQYEQPAEGYTHEEQAQPAEHDAYAGYGQHEQHDPYAQPEQHDPYAQPEQHDPYAQPEQHDPYAQPEQHDPYAQPEQHDPYGQPQQHDPYAPQHDPYAQHEQPAPYAAPNDPYAGDQGYPGRGGTYPPAPTTPPTAYGASPYMPTVYDPDELRVSRPAGNPRVRMAALLGSGLLGLFLVSYAISRLILGGGGSPAAAAPQNNNAPVVATSSTPSTGSTSRSTAPPSTAPTSTPVGATTTWARAGSIPAFRCTIQSGQGSCPVTVMFKNTGSSAGSGTATVVLSDAQNGGNQLGTGTAPIPQTDPGQTATVTVTVTGDQLGTYLKSGGGGTVYITSVQAS